MGIRYAQITRIPEVIAVAGGLEKGDAITALLHSQVISSPVTDSTVATRLLHEPSMPPRVRRT